ncbi:hypothetical protein J3459_011145 [Metarhizium acridum]|uniref:uncharacterized protein n=1 Tax=Metarhizium acridum TaxID=92637 RepID=UPI001C6BD9BA|nr:hypothetical protein J3458_009168 [Metarhizium acridum]KAG8420370.1 hypothetical protein J3459_011145 [Metarhizium acridum]
MDRVRTGVFYYCPVCGQPSGSSIPQSECLTCAAQEQIRRFRDLAASHPALSGLDSNDIVFVVIRRRRRSD